MSSEICTSLVRDHQAAISRWREALPLASTRFSGVLWQRGFALRRAQFCFRGDLRHAVKCACQRGLLRPLRVLGVGWTGDTLALQTRSAHARAAASAKAIFGATSSSSAGERIVEATHDHHREG
jgi:hypothetical protein